ncbi:DgyrCDS545 [Dimorphilus gyrociliatus]|uniref:Histone H4 n=1 Tax=Dimorphilus gyrociliatus TaxID=2664684 RepID=A0A7I8V672_9ANNE|nr:DgyrCDS545 [Dimorphilus gyrociliatus]
MDERSDKGDESEQRYAIIPRRTVRLFAESSGFDTLSKDLLSSLAIDVTYRLQEVLKTAAQYMRHERSGKLTGEHFNKALKVMNIEPILGHEPHDDLEFAQTFDGNLFFSKETEVNLTSVIESVSSVEEPASKRWVELKQKIDVKPSKNKGNHYYQYYQQIVQILYSDSEGLFEAVCKDLQTNRNLAPLIPYFSTLVKQTAEVFINIAADSVFGRTEINNNTQYSQEFAILVLAKIITYCEEYFPEKKVIVNERITNILDDFTVPLYVHYSTIKLLIALGVQAMEDLLLCRFRRYLSQMENIKESLISQSDILQFSYLDTAVLEAATVIYENRVLRLNNGKLTNARYSPLLNSAPKNSPFTSVFELYKLFTSHFGDRFGLKTALKLNSISSKSNEFEVREKLGEEVSTKCGEELLSTFLRDETPQVEESQNASDSEIDSDIAKKRDFKKKKLKKLEAKKRGWVAPKKFPYVYKKLTKRKRVF